MKKINSKLLAKITELKKENAEVKAENVKLKHVLEEHEARFTSLEQKDEEKATLIAKLDDDIKEVNSLQLVLVLSRTLTYVFNLFAQKLRRWKKKRRMLS